MKYRCLVLFFAVLCCHSRSFSSDNVIRTVAISGGNAPGLGSGVQFQSFGIPVINASGRTAFLAELQGANVNDSNSGGVWSEGHGALRAVAREGSSSPGTEAGVFFNSFNARSINLNSAGNTVFNATLKGPAVTTSNDSGIWSEGSGTLRLLAREGDVPPGVSTNLLYSDFIYSPVINDSGRTAFLAIARPDNGDFSSGIWAEGSSGLELVALTGDLAPGTILPAIFISLGRPTIDSAGRTTFHSLLTGFSNDWYSSIGIWRETSDGLELVVRGGEPAPAESTVDKFGFIYPYSLSTNSLGQVAFVTSESSPFANNSAVWVNDGLNNKLIAREQIFVPGIPGPSFEEFHGGQTIINSQGTVVFRASGRDRSGFSGGWIMSWNPDGELQFVFKHRMHAPGTADEDFVEFINTSINSSGQLAFKARTARAHIWPRAGIWAQDRTGSLNLVVLEGEQIEVLPGDFRTVDEVNFGIGTSGNDAGLPSAFSDSGEIAFHATFTDGSSGVFVSRLVAIPEPTAAGLASLFCVAMSLGSWRVGRRAKE